AEADGVDVVEDITKGLLTLNLETKVDGQQDVETTEGMLEQSTSGSADSSSTSPSTPTSTTKRASQSAELKSLFKNLKKILPTDEGAERHVMPSWFSRNEKARKRALDSVDAGLTLVRMLTEHAEPERFLGDLFATLENDDPLSAPLSAAPAGVPSSTSTIPTTSRDNYRSGPSFLRRVVDAYYTQGDAAFLADVLTPHLYNWEKMLQNWYEEYTGGIKTPKEK
ncbi:unnamed protein product, partial [Amoebophrya sp. A25]